MISSYIWLLPTFANSAPALQGKTFAQALGLMVPIVVAKLSIFGKKKDLDLENNKGILGIYNYGWFGGFKYIN